MCCNKFLASMTIFWFAPIVPYSTISSIQVCNAMNYMITEMHKKGVTNLYHAISYSF